MRGAEWRALSQFGLKMARVALARPEAAVRCVSAVVPGALHRPCAVVRAGAACRAGWGWGGAVHCRGMAMTDAAINASMNTVNDMFVEARELIADALDSQGSTYFEDDLKVPCSPVAWLHGHTRECKIVEQCAKMSRVPCGRMRRTWCFKQ